MKLRICLFIILIFNTNLYGQEIKNKLGIKFHRGINYYLSPDTSDYKRKVLFISIPPFTPEYSVALETKKSISVLKYRSFKSNYWSLVFSQRKSNIEMAVSEIDSLAIVVSEGFSDKINSFFQIVLADVPSDFSNRSPVFDGTQYSLSNNKYKREFHEDDISTNMRYRKLVTVCESVANDLKNTNFNEIKYIDLIDSLLKTEIK